MHSEDAEASEVSLVLNLVDWLYLPELQTSMCVKASWKNVILHICEECVISG